jgi:uncharacterized protein
MTNLARPIGVYFRENVYHTFGLQFPRQTFLDLLLEVGVQRIMFSVDHPYGSMLEACSFLDQILVSASDRERIAHGNAERHSICNRWIGLKARRGREWPALRPGACVR